MYVEQRRGHFSVPTRDGWARGLDMGGSLSLESCVLTKGDAQRLAVALMEWSWRI